MANRREIDFTNYAEVALSRDHLLVVADEAGNVNVMTVAWRAIGELWQRPVAIVAVAPARYSFEFLMGPVKEFTLNVMPASMRDVVSGCGTLSGRDVDKVQEFGLELVPGTKIRVPTLGQADLCYECKIIHTADSGALAPHTLFIGHIVAAFASETLASKKKK
jgi:flavin reductase (DIM6/NTAB) family NADH-FMN oxidoreductase RutF